VARQDVFLTCVDNSAKNGRRWWSRLQPAFPDLQTEALQTSVWGIVDYVPWLAGPCFLLNGLSFAAVLVALACNFLGDGLRDAIDPRLRVR